MSTPNQQTAIITGVGRAVTFLPVRSSITTRHPRSANALATAAPTCPARPTPVMIAVCWLGVDMPESGYGYELCH